MIKNRGNIPKKHNRKRPSKPYLDTLESDSKVKVNEMEHPHTKIGFCKLADTLLQKEFFAKKEKIEKFSWKDLLEMDKTTLESIHSSQLKVNIPQSYKIDKFPSKIWISRLTHALRFGGLYDAQSETFYVFWVENKHNQIYKHI